MDLECIRIGVELSLSEDRAAEEGPQSGPVLAGRCSRSWDRVHFVPDSANESKEDRFQRHGLDHSITLLPSFSCKYLNSGILPLILLLTDAWNISSKAETDFCKKVQDVDDAFL